MLTFGAGASSPTRALITNKRFRSWLSSCRRFLGARIGGGAQRGGHQRRARDDDAEREQAGGDPERAGPDGVAEHEDGADDRREVGRHRRDRDHLDGQTDLEAAVGTLETDHERDQRRERPRPEQTEQRLVRVRYLT